MRRGNESSAKPKKMRYTKYFGNKASQIEHLKTRGWMFLHYKALPIVIGFHKQADGRVEIKAWRGAADKPAFYYIFRDEARARAYVAEYEAKVTATENYKSDKKKDRSEKRAALKASDHYMVGDVLYSSWGYDQTNVDFYQVVEIKAKSVVIREIKQNNSDGGGPYGGKTAPRRNEFCGEPVLKHLDENGCVPGRYGISKWDGRSLYTSSNH